MLVEHCNADLAARPPEYVPAFGGIDARARVVRQHPEHICRRLPVHDQPPFRALPAPWPTYSGFNLAPPSLRIIVEIVGVDLLDSDRSLRPHSANCKDSSFSKG